MGEKELTGSQVRTLRLRVMERVLLPEGFVKSAGSTYVRRRDDQIHLVDFQAGRWGGDYTVNLGFHYTFAPPYHHVEPIEPAAFHLLDCAVSARLNQFRPDQEDAWREYGASREALAAGLEQDARECLALFEKYGETWRDPAWWLDRLELQKPPDERIPWVDAWMFRWPEVLAGAILSWMGRPDDARNVLTNLRNRTEGQHVRRLCDAVLATV